MRKLILLSPIAFACCATPAQQQMVAALCQTDAAAQPIAVAITPVVAPEAAGAVAVDQAVVHPAIVAACAGINATAVGATVTTPTGTTANVTTTPAGTAPAVAPAKPTS